MKKEKIRIVSINTRLGVVKGEIAVSSKNKVLRILSTLFERWVAVEFDSMFRNKIMKKKGTPPCAVVPFYGNGYIYLEYVNGKLKFTYRN